MKWTALVFVLIIFLPYQANPEEYWKKIPFPEYIGDSGIITSGGILNAIAVEPSGTIWIGGGNGKICRVESEKWENISQIITGLNTNSIHEIMVDSKNRKWFTMMYSEKVNNYVALMYDGYKWTPLEFCVLSDSTGNAKRISFSYTMRCAEDKNGIIWFTGDQGIIELFPDMSYKVFTTDNSGLPNNETSCVAVDGNNIKWFTSNGTLVSYDDKTWTIHEGYSIANMAVGKNNELCLGLGYPDAPGLMTYDGNWHRISQDSIQNIALDSDGVFWVIAFHQVGHLDYLKGIMKLDGTKTQWFYTGKEYIDRLLASCVGPDNFKYYISFDSIKIFSEETPISVNEPSVYPFSLDTASPNPFNPSTTISFSLPIQSNTELSVYSITGQKVRTLLNELMDAGSHSVVWDGRDDSGKSVSSGVFFLHLNAGKNIAVGKMLHVK